MENNTYFDEMYRIGHEWSEKHVAHEKVKEEIIKTRGWDSPEIEAWYAEEEKMNSFFWDGAVSECITKGYNAIAYELVIPETDEPLLLCIWADGHVDSGSERHVIDCMAQF